MAMKLMKCLEPKSNEEQHNGAAYLLSLKKKKFREDLITVYNNMKVGSQFLFPSNK